MSYTPKLTTPEYKQTSWWERHKDKMYGTNYQGQADAYNRVQDQLAANANQYEYQKANIANQYEYQKAVNTQKYAWNQQGMIDAGINPLAASGNLASVSGGPSINGAQGSASGGMDQGGLGEVTNTIMSGVKDMLHELSPGTFLREMKSFLKSTSKF